MANEQIILEYHARLRDTVVNKTLLICLFPWKSPHHAYFCGRGALRNGAELCIFPNCL